MKSMVCSGVQAPAGFSVRPLAVSPIPVRRVPGSLPVYFTQIRSSWSVTRWPSAGSSSEISRLTTVLRLSQW